MSLYVLVNTDCHHSSFDSDSSFELCILLLFYAVCFSTGTVVMFSWTVPLSVMLPVVDKERNIKGEHKLSTNLRWSRY
jgi:hypothetical protein